MSFSQRSVLNDEVFMLGCSRAIRWNGELAVAPGTNWPRLRATIPVLQPLKGLLNACGPQRN